MSKELEILNRRKKHLEDSKKCLLDNLKPIEKSLYKIEEEILILKNENDYSANEFEKKIFKLVNLYAKNGLSKPDLIRKMEWVLGSCKMS